MSNVAAPTSATVVAERTRGWLQANFLYMHAEAMLGDADPLVSGGVIDSMGVIELVDFLQQEFGIAIGDDEITEANLGSLQAIGQFVYRKCHPEIQSPGRPLQVA